MNTEIETTLNRLRSLFRSEFRDEGRTYSKVDQAVEYRVTDMIVAAKADENASLLTRIAEGWDEVIEAEWLAVDDAAARGYCVFHPGTRVTSRDGKYDAPCGRCEEADYYDEVMAEEQAKMERAEEAAAVAAVEPIVECIGMSQRRYHGTTKRYLVKNVATAEDAKRAVLPNPVTGGMAGHYATRITDVSNPDDVGGYIVVTFKPYTD